MKGRLLSDADLAVYGPLVLHVVPTLIIGLGFVIPNSCIAGLNPLSLGFAAATLGFIPAYLAGIAIARGKESKSMRRPRFIAEQSRHAAGVVGRIVAFVMARETFADNRRAITALDVQRGDHVLDVGCGPGGALTALAALAPDGRVAGVDRSELMAEIAVERNRAAVKARRVDVAIAPAERLPFEAASFDKALCVHVLYFWTDMNAAIAEIARVMKPRGRLALMFRSVDDTGAVQAFPKEIYRFPEVSAVREALHVSGFDAALAPAPTRGRTPPAILILATRRAL
jgi:SAM-dependent methyltransferase